MKNSHILVSCLFALLFAISAGAQPPIYGLTPEYEITITPDTLRQYYLFNVNQDPIPDLVCGTLDSIWVFDGATGASLIEPIPAHRRGFVFTPYRDSTGQIVFYMAYREPAPLDSESFLINHVPMNNPTERDSFFISATRAGYSYFEGVSHIYPFDIGSDGTNELLLFFNVVIWEATVGSYYIGLYIAFDPYGNLIKDMSSMWRIIKTASFVYDGVSFLSVMGYSHFYSNTYGSSYQYGLSNYDDTLGLYDSNTLSGGSFKHLKSDADSVEMMLQYSGGEVTVYDNPFLDGGVSRNFPFAAIPNFFHLSDSVFLLAGASNGYFELRDTQMNLCAFVWGPSVGISDAEAIDIDLDGTDELLCRIPTGFALYRLDTTMVGISHEGIVLPEGVSLFAYPNPFNANVILSLSGFDGNAEISIYDIAGRLVRRLNAGSGRVIWDGTAEGGGDAQSGIYFVSASNGHEQNATIKIALLR